MKLELFKKYFADLLYDLNYLIFPDYCLSCSDLLVKGEKLLCTNCWSEFPYVYIDDLLDNEVTELVAGRIPVYNAYSLFYYIKGNKFQNIVRLLKYEGKKFIGIEFGKIIGEKIKGTSFDDIDIIVPVPLHKKRLRQRGFNQSELIAEGISKILQKPVLKDFIERIDFVESQTRKSKYDRWLNVEGIFKVTDSQMLSNKHIMLVDDVITTGATMEALSQEILKLQGTKISIVTMCIASKY